MTERQRLEYAAEGFLSVMRRVHAGRDGASEVSIKTLAEYSPEDRSALLSAVGHAVKMSSPEYDRRYETWLSERAAHSTN